MNLDKKKLSYLGAALLMVNSPQIANAENGVCTHSDIMDAKRSSVKLEVSFTIDGEEKSGGASGVVIQPGLIATAYHVVREKIKKNVSVQVLVNGYLKPAAEVYVNPEQDLALLSTDTQNLPPMEIVTGLTKNQIVYALGYPIHGGGREVVNQGKWSFATNENSLNVTSSEVEQGQSGGPLVTCEQGSPKLAGIISGQSLNKTINRLMLGTDKASVVTSSRYVKDMMF